MKEGNEETERTETKKGQRQYEKRKSRFELQRGKQERRKNVRRERNNVFLYYFILVIWIVLSFNGSLKSSTRKKMIKH